MSTLHPLIRRCFESASIDVSTLKQTSETIVTSTSTPIKYFIKTSTCLPQIQAEAFSLMAMSLTAPQLIPKLIGLEKSPSGDEIGMVSEYFDLSPIHSPENHRQLGRQIAEMHSVLPETNEECRGRYGFQQNTYCGVTEQYNGWEEDWGVFFKDRRIGDLVRRIGDRDIASAWDDLQIEWVSFGDAAYAVGSYRVCYMGSFLLRSL
jgi:protein-ribulosamine 3-kinase